MGEMYSTPDRDPFAFLNCSCIIALQHKVWPYSTAKFASSAIICIRPCCREILRIAAAGHDALCGRLTSLATEQELSQFLKDVERRAFKRALYHVRDEEAALDIVQDSMFKLAHHYGDKPPQELPMLFQRILSNCTLDWFRRQKTRNAVFSQMSDLASDSDDAMDFDLFETYAGNQNEQTAQSAEEHTQRSQILQSIEKEVQELPARQREAFLMRYWEEMDVAETAAAMGCSEGSVKTHCFRAIQTLSKALKAKGIEL